ncbi:MAG: lytic transglycosylase domain-containing protein [Alphaproteobacteria bacterium]
MTISSLSLTVRAVAAFSVLVLQTAAGHAGAGNPAPITGLANPGPAITSPAIADPADPTITLAAGKRYNSKRYNALIARHARSNGVPVALAHAVIQIESRYNAGARGSSGEVGLMQILPRTARGIGYRGSIKALYNPDTNLRWGMKYLGEAHRRGNKTVCGTILKYNAGHHAKRMNKRSAAYCAKVKQILRKKGGGSA